MSRRALQRFFIGMNDALLWRIRWYIGQKLLNINVNSRYVYFYGVFHNFGYILKVKQIHMTWRKPLLTGLFCQMQDYMIRIQHFVANFYFVKWRHLLTSSTHNKKSTTHNTAHIARLHNSKELIFFRWLLTEFKKEMNKKYIQIFKRKKKTATNRKKFKNNLRNWLKIVWNCIFDKKVHCTICYLV